MIKVQTILFGLSTLSFIAHHERILDAVHCTPPTYDIDGRGLQEHRYSKSQTCCPTRVLEDDTVSAAVEEVQLYASVDWKCSRRRYSVSMDISKAFTDVCERAALQLCSFYRAPGRVSSIHFRRTPPSPFRSNHKAALPDAASWYDREPDARARDRKRANRFRPDS